MREKSESSSALFVSFIQACAGHPLAQATVFEECPLELSNLLIKQVVSQLDQSNHHIGGNGRIRILDAFPEGPIIDLWLTVKLPEPQLIGMFLRPFLEAADSQKVAVIFQEFFQAGASDVGEFDFGCFGSAGGLAAFENILLS